MEATESPLDRIITHTEDYLKTGRQLTQHVVTEKVVVLTATLVTSYILFAVFGMALLFASFALVEWISQKTQSSMAGLLCVSGGYALIGILLLLLRKALIRNPLMDAMVRNIYNEKNHG